ncbi:(-)-germacrene D synthase-like [Malania oleifera]|uniref:(-)-germacrene D synthase-like n=1 Tax=Malania oleifera TaxID=397392 RepID=UPI0025AEC2DE|nr:(-)-germacrene D synthase-like [Malania oleifera]
MSAQLVSVASVPSQNAKPVDATRNLANFHPSIWGDQFLKYTPDGAVTLEHKEQQIGELKEEVRKELVAATSPSQQQLKLIDAIQRLGVAYHFENEIEAALKHVHESYHSYLAGSDLYNAALLFRLLRQEGFNISCDVFNKFKDEGGNFKDCLKSDIVGMLGLYEAAHLRHHGEAILDEALAFTTIHLESMSANSSDPLVAQVTRALHHPIRLNLPRLEARNFMSIYQEDSSHNKKLLKLAKLDFNFLQSVHRKELSYITRWWKDLGLAKKLPFVRDRVVEGYFWVLGVYFEPQYHLARKILMKVFGVTSVLDDTYDAYGTVEELELLTKAIERWDINCIDTLPDYMKLCYRALLDVFEEIEEEMAKEKRSYRVYYAKQVMKDIVQAYLAEAKWSHEGYIPTMKEYMQVALISAGYTMLTTISFVGMGDIVTKDSFDWVFSKPKIVTASCVICRLMDDITSHEFEQERGHCASAVECYMKQYGASEQEAHAELQKQVVNAWKDINGECLRPTVVPMPLLARILNLARVIDLIYKSEDGYTHVGKQMKGRIASLLIDPVLV